MLSFMVTKEIKKDWHQICGYVQSYEFDGNQTFLIINTSEFDTIGLADSKVYQNEECSDRDSSSE